MLSEQATLLGQLEEIVGAAHVVAGAAQNAAFAVDGLVPELVVRPGTQDEAARVVGACAEAGAAMLPWGGGTAMGLGNIPARADVVVQLDRLDRIVEWDPANLCVTVEAGTRLAALEELTTRSRAFLPLDPPDNRHVTVGGLVAANQSGPGRLLYGSVRDWVLGLRVVLADGERIHCGGRVIKNVSGYDMNKLYIKSLGTLGIITEVTFKLLPIPAQRAGVVGLFPGAGEAWKVVEKALGSFLLPEAMEFFNAEAMALLSPVLGLPAVPGTCGLAVALAGTKATVERQVKDFAALFTDGGGKAIQLPAGQEAHAWEAVRGLRNGPGTAQAGRALAQITAPHSRAGTLAAAAGQTGQSCGLQPVISAHAGSGVIWALYLPGPKAAPVEVLAKALEDLRRQAAAVGGSLVLHEAPPELKRRLDAWGSPGDSLAMMRRLKTEFDPRGVFNPGRFVAGI
jgi:glycolate oxidase FAD binding subunit